MSLLTYSLFLCIIIYLFVYLLILTFFLFFSVLCRLVYAGILFVSQQLLERKETFILKEHGLVSGLVLLPSTGLIAGPVGDVTDTGTRTGQRQRKRDELRGSISPLGDDRGKFALYSFIIIFQNTWFPEESCELIKAAPPQHILPIHEFNSA